MPTKALAITTDFDQLLALVLDAVSSDHSRRAYERALNDFIAWYVGQGKPGLTKATVQHYRAELVQEGKSSSNINQRMSAIRKLAQEAADNGLMDQAAANGVSRVRGIKQEGVRMGNWLTKDQAQAMLDATDAGTLKGLRDRAILAVMIGGGLRRSEVAALTFAQVAQREGRWVIVDLVGKFNRVRSVPIPSWAKSAIDEWATAAGITSGHIFRPINKGGRVVGESVSPQAVRAVVKDYGDRIGVPELAAHDLRRTYAKLAQKGGAGLDQIQLSLGHASLKTTERYLGIEQDLTDAPGDRLGLRLRKPRGR